MKTNIFILHLLILVFSISSFAQNNICPICIGTKRITCTYCNGSTVANRDINGLAIFCFKCACDYCSKEHVGTNKCLNCKGKGTVKSQSKSDDDEVSWLDALLISPVLVAGTLKLGDISKERERFKANYRSEIRKIEDFKEKEKEDQIRKLNEEAEYRKRKRIEKENNKKQYNAVNILEWGKGSITSDFRIWISTIQLRKQKSNSEKRNRIDYISYEDSSILINMPEASPSFQGLDINLTATSQIKIRMKLGSLVGLMTKGFQNQVKKFGRSAIHFSAYRKNNPTKIKKSITSHLNLSVRVYDTLLSANDAKNLLSGNYHLFERSFVIDSPVTFKDKTNDEYVIEIYVCSMLENSMEVTLIGKKPIAKFNVKVVTSGEYRVLAKSDIDSQEFKPISGLDQKKLYWKEEPTKDNE